MNAFKLLTYSLVLLSASSAYAQHTVFATSGQGRGAATDARQQAQIDQLNNRTQSIKSDGTIQLQDAGTCDPAAEGTMKYDSAAQTIVYCNGADWVNFGSGPKLPGFENVATRANCNASVAFIIQIDVRSYPDNWGGSNDTRWAAEACGWATAKWAADQGITDKYCVGTTQYYPSVPSDGIIGCTAHYNDSWSASGSNWDRIIIVDPQ